VSRSDLPFAYRTVGIRLFMFLWRSHSGFQAAAYRAFAAARRRLFGEAGGDGGGGGGGGGGGDGDSEDFSVSACFGNDVWCSSDLDCLALSAAAVAAHGDADGDGDGGAASAGRDAHGLSARPLPSAVVCEHVVQLLVSASADAAGDERTLSPREAVAAAGGGGSGVKRGVMTSPAPAAPPPLVSKRSGAAALAAIDVGDGDAAGSLLSFVREVGASHHLARFLCTFATAASLRRLRHVAAAGRIGVVTAVAVRVREALSLSAGAEPSRSPASPEQARAAVSPNRRADLEPHTASGVVAAAAETFGAASASCQWSSRQLLAFWSVHACELRASVETADGDGDGDGDALRLLVGAWASIVRSKRRENPAEPLWEVRTEPVSLRPWLLLIVRCGAMHFTLRDVCLCCVVLCCVVLCCVVLSRVLRWAWSHTSNAS
jgi:hypothetical protein